MFGYIRRARALAATIRRVESEVGELQRRLKDVEQRCQVTLERTRLENLAATKRMAAESARVESAVTAMFEQVRLGKAQSSRAGVRQPDDAAQRNGLDVSTAPPPAA